MCTQIADTRSLYVKNTALKQFLPRWCVLKCVFAYGTLRYWAWRPCTRVEFTTLDNWNSYVLVQAYINRPNASNTISSLVCFSILVTRKYQFWMVVCRSGKAMVLKPQAKFPRLHKEILKPRLIRISGKMLSSWKRIWRKKMFRFWTRDRLTCTKATRMVSCLRNALMYFTSLCISHAVVDCFCSLHSYLRCQEWSLPGSCQHSICSESPRQRERHI